MKRLISLIALFIMVLVFAAPALAASLGISPSRIELEVPADGSTTAIFQVHYYSGDVKVTLVDIPLHVEPEMLHVDAMESPEEIQLTIFGDTAAGSREYHGFIKFLGVSGEMIAVAVQVRATVTNIVAGQPVIAAVPVSAPPVSVPGPTSSQALTPLQPPSSEKSVSGLPGGIAGLSTNMVIIIAAVLVFLGLVILAVVMAVKRRSY